MMCNSYWISYTWSSTVDTKFKCKWCTK